MLGKNLGTLRSLAGRYLALSAACRLPGRSSMRLWRFPVLAMRGSFAGSLEDLSGPLRLPSENLSAARGGESDRGRAHTLTTLPGVIRTTAEAVSLLYWVRRTHGSRLFSIPFIPYT